MASADVAIGEADVMTAALRRAQALGDRDGPVLEALHHADFAWTNHKGEIMDRSSYLSDKAAQTGRWLSQRLVDPHIVRVESTAVLTATVEDTLESDEGQVLFRMPMTQVWVLMGSSWQLLAGHAGPRVD